MVPLLRDGHVVVGLDHSAAMLAAAAAKIARLPRAARERALLIRADMRRFAVRRRFLFAAAAFHSVQHLITDRDLLRFLRAVRRALLPGGWLAFDLFAPDARFLARARDPARRWDRTRFRDPSTRRLTVYTVDQRYDPRRRTLLMRMHYQPVDARGRAAGRERTVRLCHRQLHPEEVRALCARAGLTLIASWGDFGGGPLRDETEQHIYLARAP